MINLIFNLLLITFFSSFINIGNEETQNFNGALTETAQTAEDSIVIEKSVVYDGQKISLDLQFGKLIQVYGWDKNKVKIIAIRRKFLKPFDVKLEKDQQLIAASVDWEEILRETEECRCQTDKGTSNINCFVFNFQVWVPENATIDINTISADLEMTKLYGPVEAKNISGFIDYMAPSKKGISFTAKSITGEIYADSTFRLKNRDENFQHHIQSNVAGSFGDGGNEILLSTISSNIYLRRSAK